MGEVCGLLGELRGLLSSPGLLGETGGDGIGRRGGEPSTVASRPEAVLAAVSVLAPPMLLRRPMM